MALKKKKAPEGAPDWLVTYGDMMTLLLCFFVIIVAMSEIKQEDKFKQVLQAIQDAFGYTGGIGAIPGQASPSNTMDMNLPNIILRKAQLKEGKSREDGIEGQNPSVRMVRPGTELTLGGSIGFETGRARLLEGLKRELDSFAEGTKGLNTKIRIRGHATPKPPDKYAPFHSLDELSFARAVAVKNYLIERGIREKRITVEACGDNEPRRAQAYNPAAQAENSRVSIIVTENLVEDYEGVPAQGGESLID